MGNTSPRKLVGWKEIAEYLRTSTRTAQRWERELGLPVHHAGSSKGYSVFAYADEFETWLKTSKGKTASTSDQKELGNTTDTGTRTSVWRGLKWLAASAIVVLVVGTILVIHRYRAAHHPKVSSITFSGRQLLAWSEGKLLWSYDLGQPTRTLQPEEDVSQKFQILPTRGDPEGGVIVAAPLMQFATGNLSTDAVYCFSSAGKLLWQHAFTDRIRFGGEDCGPRWEIQALMVTGDEAHRSAWCAIGSYPTSVSILVRIDPSGHTTRYFVNYGHLGRLNELHTARGSNILAGGINNETDEGALAVLEEGEPSGHSPQTAALSECDSCPPGQPLRYFLFPRSEVIRVTGPPYNSVMGLLVTNAQIQFMTTEGPGDPLAGIWALYRISESLVPQSVFFSDNYRFTHQRLSAEGKIKHTLAGCPERLKPITVREWSPHGGWENLPLPPVESKPRK